MSCHTVLARQRTLPHDGADNRTEMRGGANQFTATVRICASRQRQSFSRGGPLVAWDATDATFLACRMRVARQCTTAGDVSEVTASYFAKRARWSRRRRRIEGLRPRARSACWPRLPLFHELLTLPGRQSAPRTAPLFAERRAPSFKGFPCHCLRRSSRGEGGLVILFRCNHHYNRANRPAMSAIAVCCA